MVAGRGFATRSNVSVPALALSLGLAGTACSPASVTLQTHKAERALAAADDTLAKDHARYELILARLYLEKAREESGQAHYALARQLLASSERNAVLARALSESRTHARSSSPAGSAP